ncbi:hypothetical protein SAMN06265378_11049 [Paracoccus sediminis]|uniref:Uncharacterized protein n=1 Tax=Paracoccus sediminis TaxID=1214787 RepID=A0A238XI70_9RHOB|nr:hypothetical protein SAMN06265378_11049 [Paracoccus sediminis]
MGLRSFLWSFFPYAPLLCQVCGCLHDMAKALSVDRSSGARCVDRAACQRRVRINMGTCPGGSPDHMQPD